MLIIKIVKSCSKEHFQLCLQCWCITNFSHPKPVSLGFDWLLNMLRDQNVLRCTRLFIPQYFTFLLVFETLIAASCALPLFYWSALVGMLELGESCCNNLHRRISEFPNIYWNFLTIRSVSYRLVQCSEFLATDPGVRVWFSALPDFLWSSEYNWGAIRKKN
jgi:hypothetical protein